MSQPEDDSLQTASEPYQAAARMEAAPLDFLQDDTIRILLVSTSLAILDLFVDRLCPELLIGWL